MFASRENHRRGAVDVGRSFLLEFLEKAVWGECSLLILCPSCLHVPWAYRDLGLYILPGYGASVGG